MAVVTQPPDEARPPKGARPAAGWSTDPQSAEWPAQPPTSKPPTSQPPTSWGPGLAGPGWVPPPPQPGIVPLRPLGVADLLDGSIAAVRTNPRTVLGLSAVVLVCTTAVQVAASAASLGSLGTLAATGAATPTAATAEEAFTGLARTAPALILSAVLGRIAIVLLGGALAFAVGRAVIGEFPSPRRAWAAVRPVAWQLVGVTFLVALVVGLLVVLPAGPTVLLALASVAPWLVVVLAAVLALGCWGFAVWLAVRWSLAAPALVLESGGGVRRVGVVGSLRRSAELVQGAWWRTFGLLLLVAVIAWVAAGVVATPFGFAATTAGDTATRVTAAGLLLQGLGAFVGALFTVPFNAAAVTLIYVDRRIRWEGLDLELAKAAGVELPRR